MITDIFEKHTLLNKLTNRLRFYISSMSDMVKFLEFASRIWKLCGALK